MFIWDDRHTDYMLLKEGKGGFDHISLAKSNEKIVIDFEDEGVESIYKFSIIEDGAAPHWKYQALSRFVKVAQEKKLINDFNTPHFVLTNAETPFGNFDVIKTLYADPYDLNILPHLFLISYSSRDGFSFMEKDGLKKFVTYEPELIPAVKRFAEWFVADAPQQTIELWNITMVANHFGKLRQNVHRYYREGRLPPPFATAKGVPYWHPKQVGELSRALTK